MSAICLTHCWIYTHDQNPTVTPNDGNAFNECEKSLLRIASRLDGNDVLDLDDIFPRLSHSTILPWLRLLAVNG
jgi:hypothetical protein